MGEESRTTETLREKLFETLEGLAAGTTSPKEAAAVASISQEIIKTADLELRYALIVDKLDKSEQGISPGPLLLTDRNRG